MVLLWIYFTSCMLSLKLNVVVIMSDKCHVETLTPGFRLSDNQRTT